MYLPMHINTAVGILLTTLQIQRLSIADAFVSVCPRTFRRVVAAAATQHTKLESTKTRNIASLQEWAQDNHIGLEEYGCSLVSTKSADPTTDDDAMIVDDWSVSLTAKDIAEAGTPLLQIPKELIWSSENIRKDLEKEFPKSMRQAVEYLTEKQCQLQIPQFFMMIQLLREWEKGSASKWHAWIDSLPQTFSTAINMDDLELECLPPFAWSLAQVERMHCDAFCEAIQQMNDGTEHYNEDGPLQQSTVMRSGLLKWAFNAVLTRCWGQAENDDDKKQAGEKEDDTPPEGPSDSDRTDQCDMVPMGDMFNHGDPANIAILYDEGGNCNVLSKGAISRGTPLSLSYGRTTNPARFLTIFGFCDPSQPRVFCQIMVDKPTREHVQLGYDTNKMIISTADGSLSEQVWRVVLYSILDQVPPIQKEYFEAHASNNTSLSQAIERRFRLETSVVIKKHIDKTIAELQVLLARIDQEDASKHPRLSLICLHNDFMLNTFLQAKVGLDATVQSELKLRKEQTEEKKLPT